VAPVTTCRRLHPDYKLNRLLRGNLKLFTSASERNQLRSLSSSKSRSYLLRNWPRPGVKDSQKRELVALATADDAQQLEELRLGGAQQQ
jgi:hypothetical protein